MIKTFPVEQIKRFCVDLLCACGVPEDEAEIVAGIIIDTSLDGLDTHGLSRLPQYLASLRKERINPAPKIQVERKDALTAIDGDNGLGQLLGERAMQEALRAAGEYGLGLATVKHSNHFGAASYYCKMAARKQMIGLIFTNAPSAVSPWGGKGPYFGTNPIAFGVPTRDNPVIIDLSSSAVARGHIIIAAKEGRSIPLGWALDQEGRPTTDPHDALLGTLLSLGGPKGYALAMGVEVLAGILSGAAFGENVGFIYDEGEKPADIGHTFIAIDISRLMPLELFYQRMEAMVSGIKAVPLAEGFSEIRIPGERRQKAAQERLKSGILINPVLFQEFQDIATELKVTL